MISRIVCFSELCYARYLIKYSSKWIARAWIHGTIYLAFMIINHVTLDTRNFKEL